MDYQLTKSIIEAALEKRQFAYVRQTAGRWLAQQPGHLGISVLLAEALLAEGDLRGARHLLREVLTADPENMAALKLKVQLHETDESAELAWAAAATIRQLDPTDRQAQAKLARMVVRQVAAQGMRASASKETAFLALVPALAELERCWRAGERDRAQVQAEGLLAQHPRLAKAHLILADCLMAQGDEVGAVDYIHRAASIDPGGEVALRIWNGKQPYVGAWPPARVPGAAGPLPHAVAAALGLNLLEEPVPPGTVRVRPRTNGRAVRPGGGEPPPAADPPPPISLVQETLINIQTEFNRLGIKGSKSAASLPVRDTRVRLQPIYVIITSKTRLMAKYGRDGWEQIDGALQALAKAAETRLQAPAGAMYIDDAESLASFGLQPVDPADPWAVKTMLDQLDGQLEEQAKEIGWLLLVGGPDVVAFHRLPNPTDDGDGDVPSDNPYGCRDENYFLPQRVVGRLPDGDDRDPTLLLRSISTALAAHHAARRAQPLWFQRWWKRFVWLMRRRRPAAEASFGYTASVWRKASLAVFCKIGNARRLRVSPPLTAAEFNGLALGPASYGYFNLHGIVDGPAWYGQRDPTFPADYPDFPVALRPEDVGAQGCVPEVVLTEACYGAHVEGKTPATALSLRFLDAGAQMFVGSTCVAYGGINSPLEAADLLASFFWQELLAGRPGGQALQQAKVAFAKYLDDRQGYLDGEDQKTLISFVYYGDPTLPAPLELATAIAPKKAHKTWKDLAMCPLTANAKGADSETLASVSADLVSEVRARVSGYLPGMEQASLSVARQQLSQPAGAKGSVATDKMVFTLLKSARIGGATHEQVVKVTVNEAGQMLKLAVSK